MLEGDYSRQRLKGWWCLLKKGQERVCAFCSEDRPQHAGAGENLQSYWIADEKREMEKPQHLETNGGWVSGRNRAPNSLYELCSHLWLAQDHAGPTRAQRTRLSWSSTLHQESSFHYWVKPLSLQFALNHHRGYFVSLLFIRRVDCMNRFVFLHFPVVILTLLYGADCGATGDAKRP